MWRRWLGLDLGLGVHESPVFVSLVDLGLSWDPHLQKGAVQESTVGSSHVKAHAISQASTQS